MLARMCCRQPGDQQNLCGATIGDALMVIDGATNAVTAVPGVPRGAIAVNPVTNKIYLASGNVTVIDGATNATTTVTDPNAPARSPWRSTR